MTKQKMIYDVLGSPIPQHFNEELGIYVANTNGTGDASHVDFSKLKQIIDVLGNPIPQYYDVVEGKFKPLTSEGSSGGGSDARIGDLQELQTEQKDSVVNAINEVFTQVSNGKSLLETVIVGKGSTVNKIGDVPTFDELKNGITNIPTGSNDENYNYKNYGSKFKKGYFISAADGNVGYDGSNAELVIFDVKPRTKYIIIADFLKPRFRYLIAQKKPLDSVFENQTVSTNKGVDLPNSPEIVEIKTSDTDTCLLVYVSNDGIERNPYIIELEPINAVND